MDSPSEKSALPHDEERAAHIAHAAHAAHAESGRSDSGDVPLDREPEDARDYPDGGYGWMIVACGFMVGASARDCWKLMVVACIW